LRSVMLSSRDDRASHYSNRHMRSPYDRVAGEPQTADRRLNAEARAAQSPSWTRFHQRTVKLHGDV
jgi:hypothetical protein